MMLMGRGFATHAVPDINIPYRLCEVGEGVGVKSGVDGCPW